jgi:transposase
LPFRTPFAAQPAAELKIITRMREQYAAVQDLQAQGRSNAAIGRKLGLRRATARKFATAASLQDLIAKTEQRAHVVDAYTGHLALALA